MTIKIVFILLASASTVFSQEPKLTGTWDMKNLDIKAGDTAMVAADSKLTVLQRDHGEKWTVIGTGSVADNKVTLSIQNHSADTQLTAEGEKTLSGTAPDNSSITVTRLSSLYECANHTNHHVAASLKEMRNLTAKYQCTGWHAVDTTTSGEAAKVTEAMTKP